MADIYLPGMMNTGVHIPQKNTAKGSPKTIYQNPGRPGPGKAIISRSPGGRDQSNAVKTAKKAASSKITSPTNITSTTPTPSAPLLTPEDQALQGNYDPNSLNVDTSSGLSGMAGKVQLPNALQYANSMANMQYGPQIQATAGRIKGLISALPGAMDSLNKAFANVAAQRQLTDPVTSGQGVADLFGGAQGAAGVAANQAVQANNTTANQIGQGNDEAQAASRRQADWATRIQLLNNMAVNQGRTELAGEQGQLGNAKKAYYDQGLKMRGDMISQAISNQGAINNQKIAAALAGGQLESQGLTNQNKILQNSLTGTAAAYAPLQAQAGLEGQQQSIITSQLQNKLTTAAATAQLKGATGVKSMSQALQAGGANAIAGLILPAGALAQDANTGRPIVYGDLNTYFNKGVDAIMKNLPQSSRKNVKQYVANRLQQVASETNQWVYKNGRFRKVGK